VEGGEDGIDGPVEHEDALLRAGEELRGPGEHDPGCDWAWNSEITTPPFPMIAPAMLLGTKEARREDSAFVPSTAENGTGQEGKRRCQNGIGYIHFLERSRHGTGCWGPGTRGRGLGIPVTSTARDGETERGER